MLCRCQTLSKIFKWIDRKMHLIEVPFFNLFNFIPFCRLDLRVILRAVAKKYQIFFIYALTLPVFDFLLLTFLCAGAPFRFLAPVRFMLCPRFGFPPRFGARFFDRLCLLFVERRAVVVAFGFRGFGWALLRALDALLLPFAERERFGVAVFFAVGLLRLFATVVSLVGEF